MHLWNQSTTQPATLLAFLIGGGLFGVAVLVKRLSQARSEAREAAPDVADGQRDRASLVGVALQSLGIAMASGPTRVVGAWPFDGLASPRTLFTALTIGLALVLFVWSAREMGANWSIVARTRGDHRLVTTGPFALVRNPIYLGMLLFLLSLAIATGHLAALPLAIAVYAIGTAIRIRSEERLLRAQFGAEYLAYAARVRRIVPWLV